MVDLDVSSVPLVELGVAAALELTGYLSLVETSLRTLDGLGEGSRPSRVRIGGNADLVSLAGLRVLADLGALVLLRTDICHEVWRGRGLTYVEPESMLGGTTLQLWYDAFGAPPVLSFDTISGQLLGRADVTCDAIEMACTTCGTADEDPQPRRSPASTAAESPGSGPRRPRRQRRPVAAASPRGTGRACRSSVGARLTRRTRGHHAAHT